MKNRINKVTACIAVVMLIVIISTILCGCFLSDNLKDEHVVKERLERRGFNTVEWTSDNRDWQKEFTMSIHGFKDLSNVEKALLSMNGQTYIREPNGGYGVYLTIICIAYCADEQTAKTVCSKATEADSYEVSGTQGNIAYWGDKYAYQVATNDKMLWYDRSGTHFD